MTSPWTPGSRRPTFSPRPSPRRRSGAGSAFAPVLPACPVESPRGSQVAKRRDPGRTCAWIASPKRAAKESGRIGPALGNDELEGKERADLGIAPLSFWLDLNDFKTWLRVCGVESPRVSTRGARQQRGSAPRAGPPEREARDPLPVMTMRIWRRRSSPSLPLIVQGPDRPVALRHPSYAAAGTGVHSKSSRPSPMLASPLTVGMRVCRGFPTEARLAAQRTLFVPDESGDPPSLTVP